MSYQFGNYSSVNYALSCPPGYGSGERQPDNVIKSPSEGGYVQSRPRFTRVPKTFTLNYETLLVADKTVLDTLYAALKGSDSFTYTHWQTSVTHTVRFAKPVEYKYVSYGIWSATIELEEV